MSMLYEELLSCGKFKSCFVVLSRIKKIFFDLWLIESSDVEPTDTQGQLYKASFGGLNINREEYMAGNGKALLPILECEKLHLMKIAL